MRWRLVVPHFASPTTKTLGTGPAIGILVNPYNSQTFVAEREGFEPSRRSPAYTLSRRAPSTTRPPLQRGTETMGRRAGQAPCPPANRRWDDRSARGTFYLRGRIVSSGFVQSMHISCTFHAPDCGPKRDGPRQRTSGPPQSDGGDVPGAGFDDGSAAAAGSPHQPPLEHAAEVGEGPGDVGGESGGDGPVAGPRILRVLGSGRLKGRGGCSPRSSIRPRGRRAPTGIGPGQIFTFRARNIRPPSHRSI